MLCNYSSEHITFVLPSVLAYASTQIEFKELVGVPLLLVWKPVSLLGLTYHYMFVTVWVCKYNSSESFPMRLLRQLSSQPGTYCVVQASG